MISYNSGDEAVEEEGVPPTPEEAAPAAEEAARAVEETPPVAEEAARAVEAVPLPIETLPAPVLPAPGSPSDSTHIFSVQCDMCEVWHDLPQAVHDSFQDNAAFCCRMIGAVCIPRSTRRM